MPTARDQRRHERYYMQFPVTICFENGKMCQGLSQDISLGGLFVNGQPDLSLDHEMTGTGTIRFGMEEYTFRCRVARQNRAGIGVTILKNGSMLGFAITTHIFNQISSHHLR